MRIHLTTDDLLLSRRSVGVCEATLADFAIPQRLVELAEEITFSPSPEVVRVFKDRDGTYE